ncbi:MAG: TetR/AcrR family transcriptional regulator [Proteobacteria bacterium]|nr:TetR/AcrR family transcriptional regulator [Pseudomonadota bacterium]
MPRARRNDKRERLIEAADKLIYEQTFHTTTLADIAKLADVPLGNVYYYFKTKEAIMDAVLHRRMTEWRNLFQQWEQIPDIKQRLTALLHHNNAQSETLARFGCVIGSLCQELGKQGGVLATAASKLMADILKWVESQFREMGKGERSTQLATYYLAAIQGMNLLTLTFKEPQYMERQSESLQEWLAAV